MSALSPHRRALPYFRGAKATYGRASATAVSGRWQLPHTTIETVAPIRDDPAFAVALSTGEVAIINYYAPVIIFPPAARGVSHPHLNVSDGTKMYSISGSVPQPKGSGPITGSTPYTNWRPPCPPHHPLILLRLLHSRLSCPRRRPHRRRDPPCAGPPPTARFGRCIHVSNRNMGAPETPSRSENVGQGPGEKLQLVTQVFTELNQIRGVHRGSLVERTMSI
ncbi:hypothetical protein DFH08DRAFT_970873 [Mycena albidolilacea]|uniref:Uncharacterized protein n=1 Tax=Mycena albidolilacea TaxID=1033008 RepID=A0AAD6ZER6_9AGAR|nr:hypothetical protein DFH08DRAFT_970873 [Mycena albidolilacea]